MSASIDSAGTRMSRLAPLFKNLRRHQVQRRDAKVWRWSFGQVSPRKGRSRATGRFFGGPFYLSFSLDVPAGFCKGVWGAVCTESKETRTRVKRHVPRERYWQTNIYAHIFLFKNLRFLFCLFYNRTVSSKEDSLFQGRIRPYQVAEMSKRFLHRPMLL